MKSAAVTVMLLPAILMVVSGNLRNLRKPLLDCHLESTLGTLLSHRELLRVANNADPVHVSSTTLVTLQGQEPYSSLHQVCFLQIKDPRADVIPCP